MLVMEPKQVSIYIYGKNANPRTLLTAKQISPCEIPHLRKPIHALISSVDMPTLTSVKPSASLKNEKPLTPRDAYERTSHRFDLPLCFHP